MSGKFVTVEFDEKRGKWWLSWGNETFYDDDRYLRMWETEDEAKEWLEQNRPDLVLTKRKGQLRLGV